MGEKVVILLIDDQIGEVGTQHHRAFLRAHAELPAQFHFSAAREQAAYTIAAAINAIDSMGAANRLPDLILLDLKFGENDEHLGVSILRQIGLRYPALPVLVFSSLSRDVSALGECLEEGAIGFVEKACSPGVLEDAVSRALAMATSHVLVGKSPAMRQLRRQVARLSPYDQIPVLITGERGTGKERVARYIHQNGPRSKRAIVAVNCAAIPESLIESEFFGAEKGSYTGANCRRTGFCDSAHGGVLFLDEIGDLPLAAQAKLLRVLQDGTFHRVGRSQEELKADFQLICATNADMEALLATGAIREDFFDRIAAVTVRTPALRECREDIPELAAHFLRQLGVDSKKSLAQDAIDLLTEFEWPGNVRQLQRILQEAVVRSEDSPTIMARHLPYGLPRNSIGHKNQIVALVPPQPLSLNPADWSRMRLKSEIELILAAKRHVQAYKGEQWKAEFMRLVYPHCKAANAKGFADLIKRLTQGPWGDPDWIKDRDLRRLLESVSS
jgi:DNA-binding NtrC family response regulator